MTVVKGESRAGFTLIEMLIVIAVILILIVGNAKMMRLLVRSSNLARDTEAVSAILATEIAHLRNRGIERTEGTLPLPIPVEKLSRIPHGATGELVLRPVEEGRLVEVEARVKWRSVTGQRELTLATLVRPSEVDSP